MTQSDHANTKPHSELAQEPAHNSLEQTAADILTRYARTISPIFGYDTQPKFVEEIKSLIKAQQLEELKSFELEVLAAHGGFTTFNQISKRLQSRIKELETE